MVKYLTKFWCCFEPLMNVFNDGVMHRYNRLRLTQNFIKLFFYVHLMHL